jgi:hypothetical protein
MLDRVDPLRGVGEPSEVMLKAMVDGGNVLVDERDPRDVRMVT